MTAHTKTYSRFINRFDRALVCFRATEAANQHDLLALVCTNGVTGYVRDTGKGSVAVPAHAADKIEAMIATRGWANSDALALDAPK